MKEHIIWSNCNLDLDDWREDLVAEYPDASEDFLCERMVETNMEYLEDERFNLDKELGDPIIVIADLGLWHGRESGSRIIKSGNIAACLFSECTADYSEWWVGTDGNLHGKDIHHDGTNYYLYRKLKHGISATQLENFREKIAAGTVTSRDISRYTETLGKEIAKVYGWR